MGKEKMTTPTQAIQFWDCCKQTVGITVIMFDSKSYWSLLLLNRNTHHTPFPPLTHSQILPRRLFAFERLLTDSLRMPGTRWKLLSENITLKHVRIPLAETRHYVGVEWSEEIRGLKNDTTSWAISFSGSKRNIWLVLAPKNASQAKETV